jgi:hypothetical protein
MKGDFSRFTFAPDRAYTSVLTQQGRVQLDADLNESAQLALHDVRAGRAALIGSHGGSHDDAGFAVALSGGKLTISPGSYWINGLRVHLPGETAVAVDAQPFLPHAAMPSGDGTYAVVLTAWERVVSALQEPSLREVALGGPDHAVRTQLVWQVRLLRLGDADDERLNCRSALQTEAWQDFTAGTTGTMRARLEPATDTTDPCTVPTEAGYRGLDNQLYRVEVHQGTHTIVDGVWQSTGQSPTFLWSRENGSVDTPWIGPAAAGTAVRVGDLGPDSRLGFAAGDLVTLTGDTDELTGTPAARRRVASIVPELLEMTLDSATPTRASVGHAPRAVRWEGEGTIQGGPYQRLERGVEVAFDANRTYLTGDHWLIPARAITGEIEWDPSAQLPHGATRHHALIGLARRDGGAWEVSDHRNLFPALTQLRQLIMLGGDGQEPGEDAWVPRSLRVAVRDGGVAISGARVRFRPITGSLSLTGVGVNPVASPVEIDTIDGVAEVWWQVVNGVLDGTDRPEVIAELVDCDGEAMGLPLRFTADLDVDLAYAGGDGQDALPGNELAEHLRVRVSTGGHGIEDARVRWELEEPDHGELTLGTGDLRSTALQGTRRVALTVGTDGEGYASVRWTLGTSPTVPRATVVATLLDANGDTEQRVVFNSTIRRARDTRYDARCRHLASAKTVGDALDRLCRNVGLYLVSGEGQQGRAGEVLPLSIRVRVANGGWPRKGAFVRFEVLNQISYSERLSLRATGMVKGSNPVPWGRGRSVNPPNPGEWSDTYVVRTDEDGIAQAQWQLGTESRLDAQRVRVTLLDEDRRPTASYLIVSAAVTSSEPVVTGIFRGGKREVVLDAGTVLPMVDLLGLRFRDLLTEFPPPSTHEMQWWPGVKITLQVPELHGRNLYKEVILPGLCQVESDRSLIWWMTRPTDATTAHTLGELLAEDIGAGNHGAEATAVAEMAELSLPPKGRLFLDGTPLAGGDRQGDIRVSDDVRGTNVPNAEAFRIGRADGQRRTIEGVKFPSALPDASRRRLLMRVQLTPRFFPDRCAGRAADFETFYWLGAGTKVADRE